MAKGPERTVRLVNTDGLTRALNGRGFLERLASVRPRTPVAVLYLDIDRFTRVNETHGFVAGDRVLVELVRLISDLLRPDDFIGRIGGEEFAIGLPRTGESTAIELAGALREAVATEVFEVEDEPISIALKIGIAVRVEDDPTDAADLVAKARLSVGPSDRQ